ncbi:hypothetical protein TrVE_jg11372 [Triparma verrucosa]|uniref:Uncharacterized protein n=2 Tax=Triparma TaxID=722752 RepID=A0A9W7AFE3_9STRA|nr:hypothetical protein TrST_g3774 [Triparma strigata]GMH83600.1 hypothetical protein TrVE_jg11372 [Triparma verrucosa]
MSTPSFSSDLLLLHTLLSSPPNGLKTEPSSQPPTPPSQSSSRNSSPPSPSYELSGSPPLSTTLLLETASLNLLPYSPSYTNSSLPLSSSSLPALRKTSIITSPLTSNKMKGEYGENWLERLVDEKKEEGMDVKQFLRFVYDKVYKFC